MWVALGGFLVLGIFVASLIGAVHAASSARTPQGAVGWVVFLIALPVLALPIYLFLGHHRFRGYRISRLESHRVVEGIKGLTDRHRPRPDARTISATPFEKLASMHALGGNGADLLIDGKATFAAIFAAIEAARHYVLVQFYIVRDDGIGRDLKARLIAAARRGVRVRFMTDGVGSYGLPRAYSQELRDAGIEVVDRDSERGPRFRFQLNYRNHRKTVVVDGITGFIGGHNVGDEYLGGDPALGGWRDTHLRLSGPIVLQLQLIFVEDWHWATDRLLLDDMNWEAQRDPRDMTGLIVATGPGDRTETGSMLFFAAIAAARRRVWIASPYFVPDIDVTAALKHAAMRGVDVRILVPAKADHHITWLAAFAYFDEITRCGVRVLFYERSFMHQKAFLVDDDLAAVGTTNLDNRSFRLNFEAMALLFDRTAAADLARMFSADFDRCHELTRTIEAQPLLVRYGAPVARLFAPIL